MEGVGTGLLDRLDAMQRVAASAPGGPLLIVAGPGTGKTRTLTQRIAYLCAELDVYPEDCLAITFTRRAAEELRQRLAGLLGPVADDVTVGTFHSLGLAILRENAAAAGLSPGFRIAEEADRVAALVEAGGGSEAAARRLLGGPLDDALRERYAKVLRARDLVDLDELVTLPVALLGADPELAHRYQSRWPWVFVDEYQDVDAAQYGLLRLLVPRDGNLCAIGDPDQAIYSFRGADVSFFLRFSRDYGDARIVRLTRNYRSAAPIVGAAVQAIARELRYATGLAGSVAARVRLTGQVLAERPPLDGAVPAEDVHAAVDLLIPLAARCGDDLERFLGEIATGAEVDALDPRAEAVTLLTLHAAKGLEFPVVFLVGVEDGLLPLRFGGAAPSGDDVAEERRLFFVGLTRAQDRLYISHARRRFDRDAAPSPFLAAIDPGLLERRGEDGPRRPRDRQLRLL